MGWNVLKPKSLVLIAHYLCALNQEHAVGTTRISSQLDMSISPEGIGGVGMLLNFAVSIVVSKFSSPPPPEVQELVENIRSTNYGCKSR